MNRFYRYLLLLLIAGLAAGVIIPKGFSRDQQTLAPDYRDCAITGVNHILKNPLERIFVPLTGQTVIQGSAGEGGGRKVIKTNTYTLFGSLYATTLVSCTPDSQGVVQGGSSSTIRWWHGMAISTQKY